MAAAKQTADLFSTKLSKVRERAKRDPETRFFSLAHLIDEDALQRAYGRLRRGAAAGADGVTKDEYGAELSDNLRDLHKRLREGRWRHQSIRRVHIPKGQGKTRPLGISCLEDKIVQEAVREILEVLYEPLFLECSYGFRPGRGAHDALRALSPVLKRGGGSWILDADIQGYFDSIPRKELMEFIQTRVADGAFLRLIGKCLHVNILDGEEISDPGQGTVQGSTLSPLLGNIYLHHVLDLWMQDEVVPRLRGRAKVVRYADDLVLAFAREDDARRVMAVLPRRFGRFGLRLHPDKTQLLAFGRPTGPNGKGPGSFDFLGFTHYWGRSRKGYWAPYVKTRKAVLRRSLTATEEWCRRHRHLPVKEQAAALGKSLRGHFNYFAVNGNTHSLRKLVIGVERIWRKWLNRRSQRGRMPWTRFKELLRKHPLPRPRIRVQLWSCSP